MYLHFSAVVCWCQICRKSHFAGNTIGFSWKCLGKTRCAFELVDKWSPAKDIFFLHLPKRRETYLLSVKTISALRCTTGCCKCTALELTVPCCTIPRNRRALEANKKGSRKLRRRHGGLTLKWVFDIEMMVFLNKLKGHHVQWKLTWTRFLCSPIFTSRAAARSWVIVRWACCSWEDHCPLNWVLFSKSLKK